MSIAADKKVCENALQVYRQKIDEIPDELFNTTPAGGGWSYAEVYAHIMNATLASFVALEKCSNGTGKTNTKRLHWLARLMFLFNRFPPVKLKAPASIAGMSYNISKEEARNLIIKVKKRLDELVPTIAASSKYCKAKHPRLGMLNAPQWLKFINLHLEHHIKQLQRINKKFQKS